MLAVSGAERAGPAVAAVSHWLFASLREDLVLVLDNLQGFQRTGEVGPATGSASGTDGSVSLLVDLTRGGLVRRPSGDGVRCSLVRPLADYFDHETGLFLSTG